MRCFQNFVASPAEIFLAVMSIEDFLTRMKEILIEWRWMSTCLQSDLSGCRTMSGKDRLTAKEMCRIT